MIKNKPRLFMSEMKLLRIFLLHDRPWYGRELIQETGLRSGMVSSVLTSFERKKILASRREKISPKKAGRSRRKYYSLTKDGRAFAKEVFAEFSFS